MTHACGLCRNIKDLIGQLELPQFAVMGIYFVQRSDPPGFACLVGGPRREIYL